MIAVPERNAERDAAIRALLPHVPFEGWTARALRAGLADLGEPPALAGNLFPDGPAGMVEAWCDLVDREMEEAAGDLAGLGLAGRVRALVALRFRLLRPHREALRRALALLARAGRARAAGRIAARTVDAIWHAAGDRATDFSWYTKRASLAAIYGATLLYWLADESEDEAATLAFLDRRLAGLAAIGRLRRRLAPGRRAA
ncbi:MAG TPA: COQ9 family protein [Acetobacteraceae bacterium]|jgi:ubiquinone biosynthesis protein COQ9|nr:COQ9 family protein [Acetobacteraceae bacterium]